MRVGVSILFQNYGDLGRFESRATEASPTIADREIYDDELYLGNLVEPLGFDSIWSVEHHFSPYTMIPNPLQVLSYWAGRTERVDLGTMVVVLPWHDPVRLAEEIALLDNLLQGRRLTLGFGRGLSTQEFAGLRIPMEESRERFGEVLDVVRSALSNEWFSHESAHYSLPETTIRPRPRNTDLADRMVCAWTSPQTLSIAANLQLGMLINPAKPWEEYTDDVEEFNGIRAENGWSPVQPTVAAWVYCAETESEAWKGAGQYIAEYWDSARRHYSLDDAKHFQETKGYEQYAAFSEALAGPRDEVNQKFARTQFWGTPEQLVEKFTRIQKVTNASEFIAFFKYGNMSLDDAERSMRLFAKEVLPQVQAISTEPLTMPQSQGS